MSQFPTRAEMNRLRSAVTKDVSVQRLMHVTGLPEEKVRSGMRLLVYTGKAKVIRYDPIHWSRCP